MLVAEAVPMPDTPLGTPWLLQLGDPLSWAAAWNGVESVASSDKTLLGIGSSRHKGCCCVLDTLFLNQTWAQQRNACSSNPN